MGKVHAFFIAMLNILSLSTVLAGTQYEYYICIFKDCRKQITTPAPSITKVPTNRREVGSFNNKGEKKSAQFTYQYSSSNTRRFSPGVDVGFNILGIEIKAGVKGDLEWTRTDTFSGTREVPPNKVAHAIITDIVTTHTFTHKIQHQDKVSKVWKNVGPATFSKSKVITTTPEFKIEIRDN